MATQFKIVLLGEGRVGKTSLVKRYISNEFQDDCAPTRPTTQSNMFVKKKLIIDDAPVTICIWDTAGQEKFHALGPIYYRDSHGALLVYDITDADSFQKVKTWIKELKRIVGEGIVLAVAGNKCDLASQRAVTLEDAKAFCLQVGATHYETSAKACRGIEETFVGLATSVYRARVGRGPALGASSAGSAGPGRPKFIVSESDGVTLTPEAAPKKKSCCGGSESSSS